MLVVSFLIVTFLVHFGVTDDFDNDVVSATKEIVGNPSLDLMMQMVTETGDVFYMFLFGVVL
ncbi:MAG: phosphatase PAP2 family protein, partial [Nitrosopumilaceae archaeon]|nr:phosphatase PAP2 family protein [Nitrosopumilaceae archaeon]